MNAVRYLHGLSKREASVVEFSVICPNDGSVEVGLADVTAIVVKGREDVDVVFACPVCGEQVTVSVRMPHVLLAAIEADQAELARWIGAAEGAVTDHAPDLSATAVPRTSAAEAARIERYCEYFRRQLAEAPDVESALAQMDDAER
jgi:hypothetical protein